jgi:hypothetical protein
MAKTTSRTGRVFMFIDTKLVYKGNRLQSLSQ